MRNRKYLYRHTPVFTRVVFVDLENGTLKRTPGWAILFGLDGFTLGGIMFIINDG
jgi:hypothetical protein